MTTLERRVDPEWLDELPADDPRAVRSRRDLQRVNRLMGHGAIIRRALSRRAVAWPLRIAELGAGDGTLLLRVLAKLPGFSGAELVLVDRQPVVSAATIERYAASRCNVSVASADVFDWLAAEAGSFDAIVTNLFLHHFETAQLRALLALAARNTSSFIACEPRRARIPLAGSRMLGLVGCNDVTRHDAHLSVRAGFSGAELSALWPAEGSWGLEEKGAGLFSHLFVAVRSP